jgi:hypothetical protein
MMFYADGHVCVYHGDLTPLPRHYVTRERLCLRATTDRWINAMDGQPFFYVNKLVDTGLIATLRQDLVPAAGEVCARLARDAAAHGCQPPATSVHAGL